MSSETDSAIEQPDSGRFERASIDTNTPSDAGGGLFGSLAVTMGFCTDREMVEAITAARDRPELTAPPRLGELLVDAGLLTHEQVQEVLESQHKVVLQCDDCGKRYNAPKEPAGVFPPCVACGGRTTAPSDLSGIDVDQTVDRGGTDDSQDSATPSVGEGSYADLIGKSLGQYRIERLLGEGGMGAVFLAEHKLLKRKTALKVLPATMSHERDRVRRFLREAEAMAQVRHRNIVGIHHVGSARGLYFIELELVEGGTLAELLQREELLPADAGIALLRQIAEGLAAAHERGIIHRDIKSENILLDKAGVPKIGDFGLAKAVEGAAGSQDLTGEPRIMGTPSYMSPEQCAGDKADSRSDVYSLGVLFFEMLTGCRPFQGETPLKVMMQHMGDDAPPASRLQPDIPLSISNMIERMMAKAPGERYDSAREVCNALDAYLRGEEIAYTAKRIRRRRLQVIGGIVTIVLLSAGGAFGYAEWQKAKHAGPGGDTVAQLRAGEIKTLAQKARASFEDGQFAQSRQLLSELKGLAPNHPALDLRAFLDLVDDADRAWKLGDTAAVATACSAVLAAHIDQSQVKQRLDNAAELDAARAALAARDAVTAITAADAVLRSDPEHAESTSIRIAAELLTSAEAAAKELHWPPAARSASKALEARPESVWATEIRANAIQALRDAVGGALRSKDLPAAEAAAAALVESGADEAAAIADGVSRARADYDARITTARGFLGTRDGGSAREQLEKALNIWDNAEASALLVEARVAEYRATAELAAQRQTWTQAIDSVDEALRLEPDNAELQALRASYRASRADALGTMAERALQSGSLDAAGGFAAHALDIDAAHPVARRVVTEVHHRRALPDGFVYVQAGDYPIGAPDEADNLPRTVAADAYFVAKHEVSNADFAEFVAAGGYADQALWHTDADAEMRGRFTDLTGKPGPARWRDGAPTPGSEAEPVTGVSWYEARAFARWRNARLPSEAEWEIAARFDPATGDARIYPWGDEWDPRRVGLGAGQEPSLAAVGTRRGDLSALGCHDMAGNVVEWTDAAWAPGAPQRVIRGGGAHPLAVSVLQPAEACKPAHRQMRADPAAARLRVLGFRLAQTPPGDTR